jgi:hypothetical protein
MIRQVSGKSCHRLQRGIVDTTEGFNQTEASTSRKAARELGADALERAATDCSWPRPVARLIALLEADRCERATNGWAYRLRGVSLYQGRGARKFRAGALGRS